MRKVYRALAFVRDCFFVYNLFTEHTRRCTHAHLKHDCYTGSRPRYVHDKFRPAAGRLHVRVQLAAAAAASLRLHDNRAINLFTRRSPGAGGCEYTHELRDDEMPPCATTSVRRRKHKEYCVYRPLTTHTHTHLQQKHVRRRVLRSVACVLLRDDLHFCVVVNGLGALICWRDCNLDMPNKIIIYNVGICVYSVARPSQINSTCSNEHKLDLVERLFSKL